MKKLYAASVGLFLFMTFAQAQTITINTPTAGQQVPSGTAIIVNFSNPAKLNYGVSYLYKGATLITSSTSTDYPNTNYSIGTSGLAVGTDYRVKVSDAGNPSNFAWSSYFSVVTLPAPVATPAGSIEETTFAANWNAVPGATNYWLDISPVSNFSSFVPGFQNKSTASMTGNTTSKAIYGNIGDFLPGHTYYLRVRASNASGTSFNSNTIAVPMKTTAPAISAATNITATSFTANWSTPTGATEYRLDVSADNFATFVSGYNNLQVSTPSKNVTGLTAGGTYSYRVRAVNVTTVSNNSTSATVDLLSISFPNSATFVRQCESYILRYKGAIASPRAEVHLNNASGPLVQTLGVPPNTISVNTDNVISASALTVGNTYQIKVYEDGNPSNFALSGIFTVGTIPPPVSLDLLGLGFNSLEFRWTNVYGATSYSIDIATTSDFSSGIIWDNVVKYPYQASNVSVTGLTTDVPIYVRIRSYGNCGFSNYYTSASWTPTCPSLSTPTANAATTVKATSFVANWTALAGAYAGYDVVVTYSGTPTTYTSAAGTTSLTIPTLHPSSNYTYKVRGKSACTTSAYSGNINVTTLALPAPVISYSADQGGNVWKVSWYTVAEATSYEFEMFTNSSYSGSPSFSQKNSSTSAEFDKPNCGTYYIRIRSKVGTSDYSAWTTDTLPPGAGCGGRMVLNEEDKSAPSPVGREAEASPNILELTASPNPAESILRVILPSKMNREKLNFSFVDMTGRTLAPSVQLFSGYAEIDVSPIPSGVYILSISDGAGTHRAKILRK